MNTRPPDSDVVLLGVGHTNSHVLRMWRMNPLAGTRLTCVSNFPYATYSGMLPGTLAGFYRPEQMQIDLVRFCAAAGVRLIVGEVTGLDIEARRLEFADRPPVPFDVVSIGIGSVPSTDGVEIESGAVLSVKPMQTFLDRLESQVAERVSCDGDPMRATVVGGGAGGIEIAFALPTRLAMIAPGRKSEVTLVDRGDEVGGGLDDRTKRLVARELAAREIRVEMGRNVRRVASREIKLADGARLPTDLTLWATSAAAPPLLTRLGLPTDHRGFLLTQSTLQTTSGAPVFAVGDSGTIEGQPLPKAGVYAVRQGPIVWENIARLLARRPLREFKPQQSFLKLLSTGDRRAIGSYKGFSFHNRWAWRLKDWIDRRFIDQYQDYQPMEMKPATHSS